MSNLTDEELGDHSGLPLHRSPPSADHMTPPNPGAGRGDGEGTAIGDDDTTVSMRQKRRRGQHNDLELEDNDIEAGGRARPSQTKTLAKQGKVANTKKVTSIRDRAVNILTLSYHSVDANFKAGIIVCCVVM